MINSVRFNGRTLNSKEMTFHKKKLHNLHTKNNVVIKIVSLTAHTGYKKLNVF